MVVSEFNSEITDKMFQVVIERAQKSQIKIAKVCKVMGVFDMPIVIDSLLRTSNVDAVVTIGAVIKGKTKHDETIMNSVSKTLLELSLLHKKPISLAITGPAMTQRQAYARIRPVSERAIDAAKRNIEILKDMK